MKHRLLLILIFFTNISQAQQFCHSSSNGYYPAIVELSKKAAEATKDGKPQFSQVETTNDVKFVVVGNSMNLVWTVCQDFAPLDRDEPKDCHLGGFKGFDDSFFHDSTPVYLQRSLLVKPDSANRVGQIFECMEQNHTPEASKGELITCAHEVSETVGTAFARFDKKVVRYLRGRSQGANETIPLEVTIQVKPLFDFDTKARVWELCLWERK